MEALGRQLDHRKKSSQISLPQRDPQSELLDRRLLVESKSGLAVAGIRWSARCGWLR